MSVARARTRTRLPGPGLRSTVSLVDQIRNELPPDGSAIIANLAVERAGLTWARAGPALAQLCSEGRAQVWHERGCTWARRIG